MTPWGGEEQKFRPTVRAGPRENGRPPILEETDVLDWGRSKRDIRLKPKKGRGKPPGARLDATERNQRNPLDFQQRHRPRARENSQKKSAKKTTTKKNLERWRRNAI